MLLGTARDLLSSASRPSWYSTEFKMFTLAGKKRQGWNLFLAILANWENKLQNRRLGWAILLPSTHTMAVKHRVVLEMLTQLPAKSRSDGKDKAGACQEYGSSDMAATSEAGAENVAPS